MNVLKLSWRSPSGRIRGVVLRPARGFTMVETLVALVVLSIGLLGIAALYLDSLRAGRTALNRTTASQLAADLGDRIRANRSVGAGYQLAIDAASPGQAPCDQAAACDPPAIAAADLTEWRTALADALASGTGGVAFTPGDPNAYVITVRWREPGQDEDATYVLRIET